MKAFKVRDNRTGLFATAGFGSWTKNGKTWSREGDLKSALTNYASSYDYATGALGRRNIPSSWEIVVFEYVESERTCYPANVLHKRPPLP